MKVKINIRTFLFSLICILVTGVTATTYLLIDNVPSLYRWSFFVIALWYAYIMYKHPQINTFDMTKRNNRLIKNLVFFVTMILLILIWLLLSKEDIPIRLFTLLGCIIFMQINSQTVLTKTEINIFLAVGCVGGTMHALAFAQNAVSWWYSDTLTIGNANPQSVGCWACIYGCVVLLGISMPRLTWYVKMGGLALFSYLFHITLATETRTATIVLLLVVLAKVIPQIHILTHRIFAAVISAIPMLIAYTSIGIYNIGIRNQEGLSILNGREQLWKNLLNKGNQHPIFGNFTLESVYYAHNLYVEHVLFFGYVIAFVFMLLTFLSLNRTISNIKTHLQYDAYITFAGMLLMSSQESMIFSTGCGGAFVYAYCFLLIATSYEKPLIGNRRWS